MSQTIYEITSDMLQLRDMLLDSEFSEEAILEALSDVEENFAKKAEGYVIVMKDIESFAERIKAEEDRLYAKRKSIEKRAENLKNRLFDAMIVTNTDKIEGNIYTISLRKSPASVAVVDETIIPREYFVSKTTETLSKTELLKDLKLGKVVEGAVLVNDKKTLSIK